MTNEKAMEILLEEYDAQFSSNVSEALQMAIEALEKQIPKKPIIENGYIECPYCHTDIEEDKGNWYCTICGQRIDWSDTE